MDDKWNIKFLREQPFMAFGSMMNAWGQEHKGKPQDIDDFLRDTNKIFDKAIELTKKSYEDVQIAKDGDGKEELEI